MNDVANLRGYQVAVETLSGRHGRLELESITVDRTRIDYVFGGLESVDATDPAGYRALGALLDSGVSSERDAYLATYTFRASRDARGTFRIALRPDETVLLDSAGWEIKAQSASEATISAR